ncbi:DUF420 domain-containing protein [Flavobacteriales bacterium]|nr:DUF420 domain-containing protein [Flavobacteriales bacterium]
MKNIDKEKKYKKLIVALSIILPLAVAALFGIKIEGVDLSVLPPIYALINGLTAIVLVSAVLAIKSGKRKLHEKLMKTAIGLSCMFLLMYVAYHITSETTEYGAQGVSKYIYYFILISHIVLSIAVIPLVLFTYVKGIAGNFTSHKKLARITFPIWLYVAITGVVVYAMIYPYYG